MKPSVSVGIQISISKRLIPFKSDEEEVNVVLDVVSFLCDGQRKELQDTFGKETTHFAVSYNILITLDFMVKCILQGSNMLNQITLLLESVAEPINYKNLYTAKKAFQALIELCAGNFKNQEVAFRVQALASINMFLKINPSQFCPVCVALPFSVTVINSLLLTLYSTIRPYKHTLCM